MQQFDKTEYIANVFLKLFGDYQLQSFLTSTYVVFKISWCQKNYKRHHARVVKEID